MRNASMVELSKLITEESRMTEEMRSLVRARNFEVERIKLTCEQTLVQSVADATKFHKHSYEISMFNEKLRQVIINYSYQIEALNEQQRHEYRQLVRTMCANEKTREQDKTSPPKRRRRNVAGQNVAGRNVAGT
ncbi:hypothetical protein niasHT_004425 [Heterodera trifolii]|uniref:Uncharacterized protein n=1 Tax=Heterodera trifolii TaxID=157864 RepID=A0ABD2LM71_9BILA